MKTLLSILLAITFLTITTTSKGITQIKENADGPLEVGSKVPNIVLTKVTNDKTKVLSLADYKDKLIILDFWATWCGSCRAGLPKMDSLQKKYKEKLKVILVDNEDKKTVDDYFAVRKAKGAELSLPSTYEDQELNKLFLHHTIPHYVWIKDGIVISITEADIVTSENVEKVIRGEKTNFPQKTDRELRKDLDQPFFLEQSNVPIYVSSGKFGPDSIKYRSILVKGAYDDLESAGAFYTGRILYTNNFLLGMFISSFSYLFYGKMEYLYQNRVLVEVSNPERFQLPVTKGSETMKKWTAENSYTYDLVFPDYYKGRTVANGPDSIRKYACEVLRSDIHKFTGLNGKIEKRKVLCTILQATDTTKLCSKENFGQSTVIAGAGAVFNETKPDFIKGALTFVLQNEPPFVYEVNYKGRINIRIDANFGNLDKVNIDLAKFGLRIIKDYRTIDMVVITD